MDGNRRTRDAGRASTGRAREPNAQDYVRGTGSGSGWGSRALLSGVVLKGADM